MSAPDIDVAVVGAGFAGLYLIQRCRALGLSVRAFEAADDVGGTWYWNRYPGARCDVESVEYSYSFDETLQQEWVWTERFAAQPEILRYAQHVADRFSLRRDIRFGVRVDSAAFDDASHVWTVSTSDGVSTRSRFLVTAVGCLSSANRPRIDGAERFGGEQYHTGNWPHSPVDFAGKRVGVIGTGSSGIQAIPVIAEQADHLTVFQRTPSYTVPARNRPLTEAELADVKAHYPELRAANQLMSGGYGSRQPRSSGSAFDVDESTRERDFEQRWQTGGLVFLHGFGDLLKDSDANRFPAEFVRSKIAEIVDDPETAAKLAPSHTIGCKRLCLDTGYYATYNRPNVSLVDLRETPIERITERGIVAGAVEHPLEVIVYATGFDAMTGSLAKMDLQGPATTLREEWAGGPGTYLGVSVAGLPNLFIVTGPGSPSVLTNVLASIEFHVEWITDCIATLRDKGLTRIEARRDAQEAWVEHVNAVAAETLYPTCNSWYLGANVPGKPRVFMPLPGHPPYVERCRQVAADGYEGFDLTSKLRGSR